ncbi:MAG: ABC transporter ATP-binding protein [Candidatus Izimaplasma sp.]|nr:ABC transporter ATP-binding protein [Candidatus Izimaplasma bacterium]
MSKKILEVKNLETSFYTHLGEVQAVRNISFDLHQGEILGIVGESGSGKSVTSLSVMNLIEDPGEIKGGSIRFSPNVDDNFIDITKMTREQISQIRGNDISMIFQDPMTAMNPVFKIQNQMVEVIQRHTDLNKEDAIRRAKDLLGQVGIPDPEGQITDYPFQFSGGMRQRAMIATAISCNPRLLIADEPTTALDVTIQAQILELLKKLQNKIDMSIILITHDLGVIAEAATHVVVMYGGQIMEKGTVRDIFNNPMHPYTRGLHKSIPTATKEKKRLIPIEGSPPDLLDPPTGCPFNPRCPHAMTICTEESPKMYTVSDTQSSKCWLMDEKAPKVKGYKKPKGAK